MKRTLSLVYLGLVLILPGCSVTGDAEDVEVKHSVNQDIVGKWAAETYCAKLGKKPRLLKVSPTTSDMSSLYFRTKTSFYTCIPGDKD